MATPNLNITEVTASQNQKEVTINNGLTKLDRATQDVILVDCTSGDQTVSATNFTENFLLSLGGTPGAAFDLNVPATKRAFAVYNVSGETATVQVTGGGGASVDVDDGKALVCYSDGTDVIAIGAADTGGVGLPLDVGFYIGGGAADEDRAFTFLAVRNFQIPAGMTSSQGYAVTPQTTGSDMDIDVLKNGVSVGTITFADSANTATFTMSLATSFTAGDRLTLQTPLSLDALAGISLTIAGVRT